MWSIVEEAILTPDWTALIALGGIFVALWQIGKQSQYISLAAKEQLKTQMSVKLFEFAAAAASETLRDFQRVRSRVILFDWVRDDDHPVKGNLKESLSELLAAVADAKRSSPLLPKELDDTYRAVLDKMSVFSESYLENKFEQRETATRAFEQSVDAFRDATTVWKNDYWVQHKHAG
jgi:hypothetical protein